MRHLCCILSFCLLPTAVTLAEEETGFRAGFAEAHGERSLVIEAGEQRLVLRTAEWGYVSPHIGKEPPDPAEDTFHAALAAMAPVEVRFGRISLRGLVRNSESPAGPVDNALFVIQVSGEGREVLVLCISLELEEKDLETLRSGLARLHGLMVFHGAAFDLSPTKNDGSFGRALARRAIEALETSRPLSPVLRVVDTGLPVLGDLGLLWARGDFAGRRLANRRELALRHRLADVVPLGNGGLWARGLPAWPPPGGAPPKATVEPLAPAGLRANYRIDRVWLDSREPSGHPANDHFPVETYVPPGTARGAIIVLPIWRGGVLLAERVVASHLANRGYLAAIMPLPWQFQRAPDGVGSGAWTVSSDLERTRRAMVQALSDVSTLTDWLSHTRGAKGVGVLGISLGAHVAAGAYRLDPRLRAGVFVMAGGDPASMIWAASRETRGIKRDLLARGVTLEQAREFLSPLDPAKAGGDWPFPGFPRYRGALMINGTEDTVIPPENARILHAALGEPEILWLPVNHYSMATRIKEVLERTDEHLDSLFE